MWWKKVFRKDFTEKFDYQNLQYNIAKAATIVSSDVPGDLDKYEYIAGQDVHSSYKKLLIFWRKFKNFPLGQILDKQTKAVSEEVVKKVETFEFEFFSSKLERVTSNRFFLTVHWLKIIKINLKVSKNEKALVEKHCFL